MKTLERNKVPFYYCLYSSKTPIEVNGKKTGEYKVTYSTAVKVYANISQATGNTNLEQFGNSLDYDRVIVTDDIDIPITESSVLFIDKAPEYDTYNTPKYDYIVKKIAKTLNSVSIAVKRVSVT